MTFVIAVGGLKSRREPGVECATALRCGSCRAPIGEGEVYALVTAADLRRCLDCAEQMLLAARDAAWDQAGVCPWPAPPLTIAVGDARVDVIAVDFRERLAAAVQRSKTPSRAA